VCSSSRSICQIIAVDKGVPVANALIFGNLFKYLCKSLPKTKFFRVHFRRKRYGSAFNQVDVLGFKNFPCNNAK